MTAITFDTLKYANKLKAVGFPQKQAEALAEVQAEVFDDNLGELATKRDLKDLGVRLEAVLEKELMPIRLEIVKIHGELTTMRWGIAVIIGGLVALILRTFFPH